MPPLPWKKAGISRFVADHINSAKQGASLVETGFSTSLVDLFVKNREGLKRSSKKNKKKRQKNRTATESLAGDSSVGDLLLSSCPASPSKSLISRGSFYRRTPSPLHHHPMPPSPAISRTGSPRPSFSGSRVPEDESFAPVRVEDAIGCDRKSVRAKKVFVGMLKIVFLVVLALGKKQFAIGITVTAFLLHIMEFLGKCMCRLMEQCQEAHFSFRHFLEQVVCKYLRSKNGMQPTCSMEEDSSIEDQTDEGEQEEEEEEEQGEEEQGEEEDNSSFPDFSIVNVTPAMDWISRIIMDERAEEEQWDSNKNSKNRSRKIKSKIMKLWITKKKQEEYPISDSDGEEVQQQVADEKSLKNLRKIKAKFNKIIPKKLKNSKKKQKYQKKNRSVFYERFEEETECQTIDNLYEQESRASSSKPNDDDDQILPFNINDDYDQIPPFNDNEDSSDSSSDESEIVESPKKEEQVVVCDKQTMWTTRKASFVFLIPIILIGLEGGRFWAIVFTMICCLVWKFVTMSTKFFDNFQVLVAHI